jgi:hypothetical protein
MPTMTPIHIDHRESVTFHFTSLPTHTKIIKVSIVTKSDTFISKPGSRIRSYPQPLQQAHIRSVGTGHRLCRSRRGKYPAEAAHEKRAQRHQTTFCHGMATG